jgi:FkbM family methyltransferase
MKVRRLIERLRMSLLPSEQQRELKRWYADGGDEALRYNYDLDANSLVFDVGGYKGQFASDIYARYNCRILVFEPVNAFATGIRTRFHCNDRIEVVSIALGASRRSENISICDDGSSLLKPGYRKEVVEVEDVALFLSERKILCIDLMKVNIEGGEYELLPRLCETALIKIVRNLQIQFHEVARDSEMKMEDIHKELAKTHAPTYQYRYVWENWQRRE